MGEVSRAWDRIPTCLLYGALVGLWAMMFGGSIEGAIVQLRDPSAVYAAVVPREDQLRALRQTVGLILCGLLVLGATTIARRRLGAPLPPRSGRAIDAAAAWGAGKVLATVVAGILTWLAADLPWIDVSDRTSPAVADYESPALFVVKALAAGLVEEPVLAALPVLLLWGRLPIAAIVALGGTMRGLIHLYYGGYGFVWAFIWGGAAVWIYYRYRRLWVLVLLHGFVNNLHAIAFVDSAPDWLAGGTQFVSLLGGVALGLVWLVLHWTGVTHWVTAAKRRLGRTPGSEVGKEGDDPRPGGWPGVVGSRKWGDARADSSIAGPYDSTERCSPTGEHEGRQR